jgi:hypothetical protein
MRLWLHQSQHSSRPHRHLRRTQRPTWPQRHVPALCLRSPPWVAAPPRTVTSIRGTPLARALARLHVDVQCGSQNVQGGVGFETERFRPVGDGALGD